MPFLSDLWTVRTRDGIHVELVDPVRYQTQTGSVITIPAGFACDGASVPRIFWSLVAGPVGRHWRACVLHDWLYRQTYLPREECDRILLEAMISDGVSSSTAREIYAGVRTAGGFAFDADRLALDRQKKVG